MELVGRAPELAALTAELNASMHGHGRALVLLGEHRSGKTALAEAFAAEAQGASARLLWMAGRAMGAPGVCWPWPAIVRELGGAPELAEQLNAGSAGERRFEGVAAVLAAAADQQPIVLILDDADVIDAVAVDLLVFVAEQLRFRPLVVLATARDRRRVEQLCRVATVTRLLGLGTRAMRELLAANGVVVSDAVGPAVARLTGALPGEVIDLARGLSGRRVDDIDDVVRVAVGLASDTTRTEGRAAAEPLIRRVLATSELATPRVRGEVALFVHQLGGTTSVTADDRITLIEEALTALDEDGGATAVRAQLHAALARELYHGDALHEGRDPIAEAATGWELAQQSGDGATLAACLWARHDIDWRPGTAERRLSLIDEILARLDGTSRYDEIADALLARFAAYLELGDTRADREFDRFLQVAAREPSMRLQHVVLSRRAMRTLMTGDLSRAEKLIEEAARSARTSGEPDGAIVALNQRFELGAERDDRSPLLPVLERFRAVSSHPAIVASLALARIDGGDLDGARFAVAPYASVGLDTLQPEYGKAWVLSMLGEVFVALGAQDAIRRTVTALSPYAGTNIVVGAGVLFRGAVDHHLGNLLVAAGDHDAGIAHLRPALEMHERMGAMRWALRTANALASVEALHVATQASMARDGDVWTMSYAARTVRGKDSKGLRDLATLLANPGVEIRATALAGVPDLETSTDDVLDQRARDELAARLRVLEADSARADARGDQAASARAGAERDALIHQLEVTTGLAGRNRRFGDPAERARKAVSARMHDAIDRIEQQHAELGRHLREAVVMGRTCRYQPHTPVRWTVRQNESGG